MSPTGDPQATVFLSYAHADQKRAMALVQALEKSGLQVWWDDMITGGDSFLSSIETALEAANAVVVLWSTSSVQSDWVRDEATRGRERRCLVPISLDGTVPPLGFRQAQTIDFSKWRGKVDTPEFQKVLRAIAQSSPREEAATSSTAASPRGFALSRRALMGAGGAAIAGGAAFAGWKLLAPSPASAAPSVAVLPFRNLSGDKEQLYFAQGISEQIRSTLSRSVDLLVIAPTSVGEANKDGLRDARSIAHTLGVSFVLDGAVMRENDSLRITATLLEAKEGATKWNEEFQRGTGDLFKVQDEIADAVSSAVSAQTVTAKGKGTELGATGNLTAYDAYLRGNAYYALRSGQAAYRSALTQYDIAVREDPDFALAHAARALVIVVLVNAYGKASEFRSNYDDALASAQRAVKLAPDLAYAQATLGYVLVQGKVDIRGAAAPFAQAQQLGQGDATVLTLAAIYNGQTGRIAEAESAINRAIALDPLNAGPQRISAFVAYSARNWDQCIARAKKALAINRRIDAAQGVIGDSLVQKGKLGDAFVAYGLEPDMMTRLTGQAICAARMNDPAGKQKQLDALIDEFGDGATYQQAQIAAQSGDLELAMERLAHARQIGDAGLALARGDPMLDPLRERPDFKQLLTALGFG